MSVVKPKARLHLTEPLAAGTSVSVSGDQAHYLRTVMRAAPGDIIGLFNGRDGEWLARITTVERRSCDLAIETLVRPQRAEPGPWLLFAPIKKTALDFLVEKATELGAERLWPVVTERTVAQRVNLRRLHAHAIEAAEQCERLTVPDVVEPVALSKLADVWPAGRSLFVLDSAGTGRPLAEVLQPMRTNSGPPPPHALLIGPEGGLASSELDALLDLPFATAVGLGPRILRAETAALAALTCWQTLVGDGMAPPRS